MTSSRFYLKNEKQAEFAMRVIHSKHMPNSFKQALYYALARWTEELDEEERLKENLEEEEKNKG